MLRRAPSALDDELEPVDDVVKLPVCCLWGLRAFLCKGSRADFVALGVEGPLSRALAERQVATGPRRSKWRHITILYDTTRRHWNVLREAAKILNNKFNGVDFAFELLITEPSDVGLVCNCSFLQRHVDAVRVDCPGVAYSPRLHVKL